MPANILVLGGTTEARALADHVADDGRHAVVTALAGRTAEPTPRKGTVHLGSFGGTDGLRDHLLAENIDLLVDATHPFAARISIAARQAARSAGRPYLRLERPGWVETEGDRWTRVASLAEAAETLAPGANAFVTVGRQELGPFLRRPDATIVARTIEKPEHPLPERIRLILDRPPYALETELVILARYRIDVLVTKNSGGDATAAKLVAARQAGLPVIMIDRPGGQPPADAADVKSCLALIERHLHSP
ncbi:cobalt-precorrin-6A reductase [Amorphus coralli]|uniref:cobalt-precorrin-6A reductase n=1 Tax=Amorphus coralli TaxID=340680 RepID=UPI000367F24A|nr:cobalt-precorrin-6A reductase [Amorphus coralli]